jgi:photosystem II stability/assembly factor-like uncharacterized protein
LDNIAINPISGTLYVAGWNVDQAGGELWRSPDGGQRWERLPLHGQSIRALALAPSDPKIMAVGTLDGVFRSRDSGSTWERISPPHSQEIRNVESLTIDPIDPDTIYAGTWHLPWKTEDGGRTWHSISPGLVDDSDIFSIIVDRQDRKTVYLSACTGVYKSDNAGESFHRVREIPVAARRARILRQDPIDAAAIYAGTTRGLWKSADRGVTWRPITPDNLTINAIHIDPRNSQHVVLATDHGGILRSEDGGQTFTASNQGFAHRQVSSLLADRFDPQSLYAGLVNDGEFGGVYVSHDHGRSWTQAGTGMASVDVLSLAQTDEGDLLAGTSRGIFALARGATAWSPLELRRTEDTRLPATAPAPRQPAHPEKPLTKWILSKLEARVAQLRVTPDRWLAATSEGLFLSHNEGKSWEGGPVLGLRDIRGVESYGAIVVALAPRALAVSRDAGDTWKEVRLPAQITLLNGMTMLPDRTLWLAAHEGVFRSRDFGLNWESLTQQCPATQAASIAYDPEHHRLLVAGEDGKAYASMDGNHWQPLESPYFIRSLADASGRLLAATAFDGIVAEPDTAENQAADAAGSAPSSAPASP